MDTIATLLNKTIENITNLNSELNKLKSSHNILTNKYLDSCNTITYLQNKITTLEKYVNPNISIDFIQLEELMIKICQENPNNLGPKGPIGDTGYQGDTGCTGATGCIGANGMTGATGFTGSQGQQGIKGIDGNMGAIGMTGATGYMGATGYIGATGNKGINGILGIQGIQGEQGMRGEQGIQGIQGLQGLIGNTGPYAGGNSNLYSTGNLGSFQSYNRALSAAEVRQNYNSTKRRYL